MARPVIELQRRLGSRNRWDRIYAGLRALLPSARPTSPLRIGQTIARFRVHKDLGVGTMGWVYLAENMSLARLVAVKVFRPMPFDDGRRRARFLREAQCAAAIKHPHIAAIHDIGRDRNMDFIVMEFVPGRTLDKAMPLNGLDPELALGYARQLASALACIHSAGMIHRDVKPANIMIDADDAKLLDFGLAKYVHRQNGGALRATGRSSETLAGTILGAVGFMSPEQVRGAVADARSDIFSFGAVVYQMLTGRRLFRGRSDIDTMSAILHQPVPPLPKRIPPSLVALVRRCLERQPRRRYKTGAKLLVALDSAARDIASPGFQ